MNCVNKRFKLPFESVAVGAQGHGPVLGQRGADELNLPPAHLRLAKQYPLHHFTIISLKVENISLMSFQNVARSTYSRSMASLSGITCSI